VDEVPVVPQISRAELESRLHDPDLIVVNVLARDAWEAKRIPGSLSLPLAELPTHATLVLPDKDADIAVYCASPT
jgi:rhodanese-related sulfurtransferase